MRPDPFIEPSTPVSKGGIPLSVPEIRGNEWKYIKECLDSNWVSSVGAYVERFENSVADYVGMKHGVAAVNGTAALHIALLVAGVQPNDEVLVSTLTFIAPANAVRYVGAWPVFIDAEEKTWQMDPQMIIDFIERRCYYKNGEIWNRHTNRRIKAILPVHILGHPVNMDPIREISMKYDLTVIEDASEALGARFNGKMVGSFGKLACFSFNGNKLITTGGGGMLVTDDDVIAEKAKYLTTQAKDDPLEYVHHQIGYNYRLVNLLAAMGVAQMEQVDSYIAAKRRIAEKYRLELANIPGIQLMPEASWASSTYWLYTVLINEGQTRLNSRQILQRLGEVGIQTRPLWTPIHLNKPHRQSSRSGGETAEKLWRESLSLPCSVGLTSEDQDRVIHYLKRFLT